MTERVLIIGGGNMGTYFACQFATKGWEVRVFTSQPGRFSPELQIEDSEGKTTCSAKIALATDDIGKAMEDCRLIFVTLPAFLFRRISDQMEPHIQAGVKIGIVPGAGGAEFSFSGCMKKGAVLFGLQRVPAIARIREYGHIVCVEGRKDRLFLASIPGTYAAELSDLMGRIFEIPCDALPNYLNVTLTPSNPILHTTRLCAMFHDYHPGMYYERNPLFYEEWDLASSELLLACDDELERMKRCLSGLDLTMLKSLRDHYESSDAQQLTAKIRSLKGLFGIRSPMVQTEHGWIPDLQSRYFTADFPYGLSILVQFAHVVGTPASHMEQVMDWYKALTGNTQDFDLAGCGITTLEDIYRLYSS